MPAEADHARRLLPAGLTGLSGIACAACCLLPLLLAAGVVSGAGWAAATAWLPGVALALAAAAGGAWWWASRRHRRAACAGGDCACSAR
ncbi:hypothetical protein ACTI_66590 [Actinoplanes sp. OR16]|uniref:hypothetical protein n=1 Tax=Actinoplanes sp. OR16 TaxID=946334 RepID=UPI000F6DB7D5|nr:hypothetical protein [Actinoplanes sp. OR16]BBH69974.1 hypothetical protein ACTI_66590 [Actinoplanes sp. OR16]